jgi:hypothetical protein
MRFLDPPTLDAARRGLPGDDLDGLLSAFFRTEMPCPWPGAPVPEETPVIFRPAPVRRSSFRSRLALAASVALLIAGAWLLGDSFKDAPDNHPDASNLTDSTADTTGRTDDGTPVRIRKNLIKTNDGIGVIIIITPDLPEGSRKSSNESGSDILP